MITSLTDMSTVIGVDSSSSRLAAVVLSETEARHFRVALPGAVEHACQRAYEWAVSLVDGDTIEMIDLAVIEAPFFHAKHPTGAVAMSQVNGALLAGLSSVPVASCPPSVWKKHVVGKGNAGKQDIATYVQTHYPEIAETFMHRRGKTDKSAMIFDQDLADSLCIALYARDVHRIRSRKRFKIKK